MKKVDYALDEELLLAWIQGSSVAQGLLTDRYFKLRFAMSEMVFPGISHTLDSWDLNHAFFLSFENALKNYEFGKCRFESFFLKIYGHELQRESMKKNLNNNRFFYSLESEIDKDGDLCFHDVIKSPNEDPRLYIDYIEQAERIGKLPKELDRDALKVMKLKEEGFTFNEIADALNYSLKKVRRLYEVFKKYVKKHIIISPYPSSN